MSTKQKEDPYKASKGLLKTNTRVSKSIIDQYNELEAQLEKLGIDIQPPGYTLSPPLGGPGPTIKGYKQN